MTEPASQLFKFRLAQKHKLAIIGFGWLAQRYYVPALRIIGMAEIVAVADPLAASRGAEAVFSRTR